MGLGLNKKVPRVFLFILFSPLLASRLNQSYNMKKQVLVCYLDISCCIVSRGGAPLTP